MESPGKVVVALALFWNCAAPAADTLPPTAAGALATSAQSAGAALPCLFGGPLILQHRVGQQSNVWLTISGGTQGEIYDLFSTTDLLGVSITNSLWTWLGRGTNCQTYLLTGQPWSPSFYVLGLPVDGDADNLTDAYEWLASKTNPTDPDTDNDELLDGWEVALELNPKVDESVQSGARRNYTYDSLGRLRQVRGVNPAGFSYDKEGNLTRTSP